LIEKFKISFRLLLISAFLHVLLILSGYRDCMPNRTVTRDAPVELIRQLPV